MADTNIVILAGRLTRNPEIKYLPSGAAVSELSLAIGRKFKDSKTEEWKEETTFVDITVFGRQAETVCQYQSKGSPILVEGRLRLDQWDDRETGKRRSKLKVVATRIQFLSSGPSSKSANGTVSSQAKRPSAESKELVGAESGSLSQGDIPF